MSKNELYAKYGATLKAERERQQLDLEELAEQLKINLEHLEAIESGDIDSLPSELYFALFAKSYSEALGLDYTRTMEAMKEEFDEAARREDRKARKTAEAREQAEAEAEESEAKSDAPKGKRFTGRLLLIFALLVIAFLVFVFVAERVFDNAPGTIETHDDDTGEPAALTGDRETERYGDYDWSAVEPYEQPEKLSLAMTAERDSWVTVVADGDTVIFRQLDAGRSATATADYRLRVSISVPSAVTTRLNDEVVELRDPNTRRISRVEINQANVDRFLNPEKYLSQASPSEPEPEPGVEPTETDAGTATDESTESQ